MKEMQIIYLDVADVIPYENNPRNNDAAVEYVANSISEFGFKVPIIIDENNVIVAGHTRLKAAKRLGLNKVPCIKADDLSEDQVKAFRLADNKVSELAEWDFEKLDIELEDIELDMSEFGFDDIELEEISFDDSGEADEIPELPEEPKTKYGDLYQLDNHRLMCGDATKTEDVERLMNGEKADMVFTDPPYNVASDSKNFAADVSKSMGELLESEWDHDFPIRKALDNIYSFIADDVTVYICTQHFLAPEIWNWMKEWKDHYSYCVWSKPNPMPSLSKRHWTWNSELICYATRGKHTFNFPKTGHALSTWTINKRNGETGHPTEKPVAVPEMGIIHSSLKNDIVLDLFGGSGSTLIACEETNRRCRMMEIDPKYCDVIIERWENFTGKKAIKLK